MGINGLSSFVRSKAALQTRRLWRCRLVVDGTNLCHFLYDSCKAGWRYGGDYDVFAQEVREVMEVLLLCKVQPYVVMDGSDQLGGRRLQAKLHRNRERQRQIQACQVPVLPVLAMLVFQAVLRELQVPLLVIDFQADRAIASLAKHWDCPVLSNDSDFCIFGLKRGVAFIDKVNFLQPHRLPDVQHFILAKVFYAKDLIKVLGLRPGSLPLFATLVGHDLSESKTYHKFLSTLDPVTVRRSLTSRHALFEKVIQWLKSVQDTEQAVEQILAEYTEPYDAEDIRSAIAISTKRYTNISSGTFLYAKEWFEDDQSSSSDSDDSSSDSVPADLLSQGRSRKMLLPPSQRNRRRLMRHEGRLCQTASMKTRESAQSSSESEDDTAFLKKSSTRHMPLRSSVSGDVDEDDGDSFDQSSHDDDEDDDNDDDDGKRENDIINNDYGDDDDDDDDDDNDDDSDDDDDDAYDNCSLYGMPSWCAQAHRSGLLLPSLKMIFKDRKTVLLCQVEDFNVASANLASQGIRKVTYGILARSNNEWRKLQDSPVQEFDRCERVDVQVYSKLPGMVERLPSLQQVPSLTVEKRLTVLAATLGVETGFLATLPAELRLLGGVAVYWVRRSSPRVSIHHLHSLLVCVILLHARLELRARRKGAQPECQPLHQAEKESPDFANSLPERLHQSKSSTPESTERLDRAETKDKRSLQPGSWAREERDFSRKSRTRGVHASSPKTESGSVSSFPASAGTAKPCGLLRGDPQNKETQPENTGACKVGVPEQPQSLQDAMKSWPLSELQKVVWDLQRFHSPTDAKPTVDLAAVHGFAQLQACLLDAVLLCGALQWPVPFPLPHLLINATFLTRFQCHLAKSRHPDHAVKRVLGTSAAMDMFWTLVERVLSQLPADVFETRVPAPDPDVLGKGAKSTGKKAQGPRRRGRHARH